MSTTPLPKELETVNTCAYPACTRPAYYAVDGGRDQLCGEHYYGVETWELASRDATLGVGHVWTEVTCPAYKTLRPSDCHCAR